MKVKKQRAEAHVSYRLGQPYSDKLAEMAGKTRLSPHQYARLVLVTHFEETAFHQVAESVEQLKASVDDLRVESALARRVR